MRKLGVWGLAAVLSLGLASRAAAEDEKAAKKPAQGFWGRLFNRPSAQEEIDQLVDAQEVKAQQNLETVRAREEAQKVEALRSRDRYLRRELVLDRIQQLALEAGDTELSAKIDALRERAFTVYWKKGRQPSVTVSRPASE